MQRYIIEIIYTLFQITGDFIWIGYYGPWIMGSRDAMIICLMADGNYFPTSHCNIGPFLLSVINLCSVILFYALILLKMVTTRYNHPEEHSNGENLKSISKTLILLTGAYMAFLVPPIFHFKSTIVRTVIASWYVVLNH